MTMRTLSHRLPFFCRTNAKKPLPELHLMHTPDYKGVLRGKGVLLVTLPSGVTYEVELDPRYTRLLFAIAEAWLEDAGGVEGLRGFRTNPEIAQRITELSPKTPKSKDFDPELVPSYVYDIRSAILKNLGELDPALRGDHPPPQLLENAPGLGYRVGASGLEVVRFRTGTTTQKFTD